MAKKVSSPSPKSTPTAVPKNHPNQNPAKVQKNSMPTFVNPPPPPPKKD